MNNQKLAEAKDKVTELAVKAKTKAVDIYRKHPVACTSVITGITGVAAFAIGKTIGTRNGWYNAGVYVGRCFRKGTCLEAMKSTGEYEEMVKDLPAYLGDRDTGEKFDTLSFEPDSINAMILADLAKKLLKSDDTVVYKCNDDHTAITGITIGESGFRGDSKD